MPPIDREAKWLSGRAFREIVRKGSASQHEAVVLHVKGGAKLILQRRGGNPFNDPKTPGLVGHSVKVKGFRLGDIFRYTEVVKR